MSDPSHHEEKPVFWLLFEYSEWIDTPEKRESEDSWTKLIHDFLDEKLQDEA